MYFKMNDGNNRTGTQENNTIDNSINGNNSWSSTTTPSTARSQPRRYLT